MSCYKKHYIAVPFDIQRTQMQHKFKTFKLLRRKYSKTRKTHSFLNFVFKKMSWMENKETITIMLR